MRFRHFILLLPTIVCLSALFGCNQEDEISRYPVPKTGKSVPVTKAETVPYKPPPLEDRMLGAIIPHGGQVWYFKLVGPIDDVAPIAAAFREFVSSVHFVLDGGANADWTVPEGWHRLPDGAPQNTGFIKRYATLMIDTENKPLEFSVTALPGGGDRASLWENVNRWRKQMTLQKIKVEELTTRTERVPLADGAAATVIDLLGKFEPSPMGRAPFLNR